MMQLSPRGKTLLWAGVGAFGGLALGMLIVDADAFVSFSPVWLVLLASYVGGVYVLSRDKDGLEAPKKPRSRPVPVAKATGAPAARPQDALRIEFSFPDVPPEHPPVMGVDDALHIRTRVASDAGPSEGAAVRLSVALRDGARFVAGEGVTGTDGTVAFTIRSLGVGELILEAEASLGNVKGAGMSSLSVVRYEEEIERLFAEFRSYAHAALGPDSSSDTARELAERLRVGADGPTSRALLELARIYELVAYGERDADRRLYLSLVNALLVMERAPAAGGRAVPVEG